MYCVKKGNLDDHFIDTILLEMEDENDQDGSVITVTKNKVKKPRLYKVLLHNDDYTTMEFVIYVLKKHFRKDEAQAQEIMLSVHNNGVGVCGVFTHEIAESKVGKVMREAKKGGYPLLCSFEPE
jgi:ATP-dependent Clp protease adaptor protein ClpS